MAAILVPILSHLRASGYTSIAGSTVLFYDILITSESEIRLIWPSRWSLVKVLYFINRYFPVPCLLLGLYHLINLRPELSVDFCRFLILSQIIGQALGLFAATWLLVLRVAALYGGKRFITIGLYFIFITTHSVSVVVCIIFMKKGWQYVEIINVCDLLPNRLLGAAYFSPVVCEAVLVGLQLFHGYRHSSRGLDIRKATPLLRTLYSDGFIYFLVVAALRLWNAFNFTFSNTSYWFLATYFEFSLVSVSVSRLVLHLRGAAIDRNQDTDFFITALSVPSPHRNLDSRRRRKPEGDYNTEMQSRLTDMMAQSNFSAGSRPLSTGSRRELSVDIAPRSGDSPPTPGSPYTPDVERSKNGFGFSSHYPFHSRGLSKTMTPGLDIPSTSTSWLKRKAPRRSDGAMGMRDAEGSEVYLAPGGDGDSYMELSPVTPAKGRDIRSMDGDERVGAERQAEGRPVDGEKSKGSDRSDFDFLGTGVG